MIFGPDYIKEVKKPLTLTMKVALGSIVISATRIILKNHSIDLPVNIEEFTNYVVGFFGTYGFIKFCAGFAPLPKEPEGYMLTDAIRFRKEGFAETLLSLSSLVINNKDNIINLFK